MENKVYDLVIIGGGPGGLTAGIYAMRAALNTVLIEKGLAGGQMTLSDQVENYPGIVNIGGQELSRNMAEHAGHYGLEVRPREVVNIEPGLGMHQIRLDDDSVIQTHAVIMGMGGNPRKVAVPGEEEYYGKGVSYCAVCDGFFFRNRKVVVIGGGDSAAEESLYLAKIAEKVYLVHRRDELRAGRILQKRVQDECKIEVLWSHVPVEIKADQSGVNAVTLKDLKNEKNYDLATEGVFIFVGFNPNNQLVPRDIRLNADGYVMTDEKCETNVPGIFAIGDLRQKYARQIITAAADGCTAALAAAHYVENKRSAEACAL